MTTLGDDIDATITSAVNARIEAEVMRALSGDETIGAYVAAALRQTIEVKNAATYRTDKVPFLTLTLRTAIQEATKAAVAKLILEEAPTIENEVRKALRRSVIGIAETLTQSLTTAASKPYGVNVALELRMPANQE